MQIRYNLTKLEEWARSNGLEEVGALLLEAVQISQLLQVNKSHDEDVELIRQTCSKLSPVQVQKILSMYMPGEHDEDRVPASVIQKVVAGLGGGGGGQPGGQLMLDAKRKFTVTFRYRKGVDLGAVAVPKALKLGDYLSEA